MAPAFPRGADQTLLAGLYLDRARLGVGVYDLELEESIEKRDQFAAAEAALIEAISIASEHGDAVFEMRPAQQLSGLLSRGARAEEGRRRLQGALSKIPNGPLSRR
jgi:hypothetical protein